MYYTYEQCRSYEWKEKGGRAISCATGQVRAPNQQKIAYLRVEGKPGGGGVHAIARVPVQVGAPKTVENEHNVNGLA